MSLLDRIFGRADSATRREDYDTAVRQESAKVKAYRTADEVAKAAQVLMHKANELRAEIEGLPDE